MCWCAVNKLLTHSLTHSWSHHKNRKYITYRNASSDRLSHGHSQHAQKFGEVLLYGFWDIVVWATTSCSVDWSKSDHVTWIDGRVRRHGEVTEMMNIHLKETKVQYSRYGNSRAICNHTVLPVTRQKWHSRLYPGQVKLVLDLATL